MRIPILMPKLEYFPTITYANGSYIPLPNVTSNHVKWGLALFHPKLILDQVVNGTDWSTHAKVRIDNLSQYSQTVWLILKIFLLGLIGLVALVYGIVFVITIWHIFHEHVILFFTENHEWIKEQEEAKNRAQESNHRPYEEIEMQPLKQKPDHVRSKGYLRRLAENTEVKILCYLHEEISKNNRQKKSNRMRNREIEDELALQQQQEEEELELLAQMIAQSNGFTESVAEKEYHEDSDSDWEYNNGGTNTNKRPAVVVFEVPVDIHVEHTAIEPVAGPSQSPSNFHEAAVVDTSTVYLDRTSYQPQNQNHIGETEILLKKNKESNQSVHMIPLIQSTGDDDDDDCETIV